MNQDQKIELLALNKKFQQAVSKLREQHDIPKNGFTTQEYNSWRLSDNDKTQYQEGLQDIIETFSLGDSWITALDLYVLLGNKNLLRATSPWKITYEYSTSSSKKKQVIGATISIDAYTTEKQVVEAYRHIRKTQKLKKKQPMPEFDRNIMALRLRNQGLSIQEITTKLNEFDSIGIAYTDEDTRRILRRSKNL